MSEWRSLACALDENLEKGSVSEMKNRLIFFGVLSLFVYDWAFGRQSAPKGHESHKYRTLFTLSGGEVGLRWA
jgi:hypothetical protein